ncbi:hypothetical protein RHSIM_RhsimUnG0187500 [Rhododendron simsii]|uniref:RING-type E3 ubiquitin transferase n=1 Tax=Rhododendron simsii TaxID=118357 RepID=A0A834FW05_RHOSS|nr:hypothetical protein RHSIM_RhsimUnG0187500 [Rhododendron simsii]
MKRTSSLPVTPIEHSNPESTHGGNTINCYAFVSSVHPTRIPKLRELSYGTMERWVLEAMISQSIHLRREEEVQPEETHDQFLDQDHGPAVDHPVWYIRTVGLQSSVINSIAICQYKRGDGLVEGTECSVCLNEFEEDEILRLLPKCNHAFHIPCIDTWLRTHTNCPLCRAGIVGNAGGIPTALPGQSVDNPAVREEDQVVVSEIGGEFRREREDEELMGIEEGEREVENREKSLETPEEDVVHQPKRRSMSMDSVYASMTNAYQGEIGGSSGSQTNESSIDIVPDSIDANRSILKFVGGSSIGRSPQKGPISMERSPSCSGKG